MKSIAFFCFFVFSRAEFDAGKFREHIHHLHKMGRTLHNISRILDVPIVVTNQVTAVFDQIHENFGRPVLPCFGVTWTNYVHTRIYLSRTDLVMKNEKTLTEDRLRKIDVDFSPVIPNCQIHFVVNEKGVKGIAMK